MILKDLLTVIVILGVVFLIKIIVRRMRDMMDDYRYMVSLKDKSEDDDTENDIPMMFPKT